MASESNRRLRVLCISPAHPPNDPRVLKTISSLTRYEVRSLLPWSVASSVGVLPFYSQLALRLVLVHPLVVWYLIRHRPRILHLFMPELLPIALLFRLMGGRVVYDVQENHRLKFDRKPRNKHPVFRWLFKLFDRLARQYCYCIFTEASYLSEYATLALPHALVHNFPSIRDELAPPNRVGTQPNITSEHPPIDLCYLGLVSEDRGLDTMVEVVTHLKKRFPSIRLHLFGRLAGGENMLRALRNHPTIGSSIIYYGHVGQTVAFPIMGQCAVGLALLKPVGDYPDSYPSKLFEYMALGLPVIVSDFPLYRSVVETHNCGFCVDPMHVEAIAEHITWLITYPMDAKRLGLNGRRAVEELYNWEIEVNKLLELYQKIDF